MNCIRAVLATTLALLLGSCGEVERYRVFTSVTFEDGATSSRQMLPVDCEIVHQRWRMPTLHLAQGVTHWLARADGSILVLEPIAACYGGRPSADQPVDLNDPLHQPAGMADHSSWLFDQRDAPHSVDQLNTKNLLEADRGLRLSTVELTTGPATTTAKLVDGFPGLQTLDPSEHRIIANGHTGMIVAGNWVGARAELWRIRPGETCDGPAPTESCADQLRYLRATPDPDFSMIRISPESQQDAYRMTYHDPRGVLAGSQNRIWRPMICAGRHCGVMPKSSDPLVLPGQRDDLLIVVRLLYRDMNQRSFEPL
jgi:hypothetical protein